MNEDGWVSWLGSVMASFMFLWAVVSRYFPNLNLESQFSRYTSKFTRLVHPYVRIDFPEQTGERLKRSEAYTAIENYLASTCSGKARKLKADMVRDGNRLDLSMDDHEEVVDTFRGARLWWTANSTPLKATTMSFYPASDEKRSYRLTFHCRDQDLVRNVYLDHIIKEGRAAGVKKRQRRLYTNSTGTGHYEYRVWIHVPFEHPATFDTVAMDPIKKHDIVQDLIRFSQSKDYYARIGKAWKRGYLLYGPPGTGKSSLVAAMANLLDYDVYDLELTAVKNNTSLRKLLINTTSKSIIVLEDIDCSLDLTGKRKKKKEGDDQDEKVSPLPSGEDNKEDSKVTLSGLLNFIDGLWSACGGERLIVFTTNHVEKLDPALIRRGRMDKHIELSYCGFEAFKVLAWNYLEIKEHPLFDKVRELIAEVKMTPADVAENLIPKNKLNAGEEEATACLQCLIAALEESKSDPIKVRVKEEEEDDNNEDTEGVEQKKDETKTCGKKDGEKEQTGKED